MPHHTGRAATVVAWLLAAAVLFAACGGDDGGEVPATQTPFIAPSPYTTEEAIKKLDEIELKIRVPDPKLIERYSINPAEVQQRIELILNGTSTTSGLDDARVALREGNRILAAEYTYNAVMDFVLPAFGSDDIDYISQQELDEIDPGHVFVEDHSQGLLTTAVFKEVAIALIHLWYRMAPG